MKKLFLAGLVLAGLALPAFATVPSSSANNISYLGTGSVSTFTVPFKFLTASDLVVSVNGIATTAFTTTGAGADAGGSITLTTAPASGVSVLITRSTALGQPTSFRGQGGYSPASHEKAFDRLAMQIQDEATAQASTNTAQAATNAAQVTRDAGQDASIAAVNNNVAALNTGSHAVTDTSSVLAFGTTAPRTLTTRFADVIRVRDFTGVVANDTNDDTAGIQAAITQAAATSKALSFCPAATYRFSSQLVFSGVNVDFCNSNMHWVGPVGTFAMVLDSNAGAGSSGTDGNAFDNLTLYQTNFAAFVTLTGSAVYDPPSVASGSAISNSTPGGVSTTVSVPGATTGGFARATFTGIVDGIELTARVTAADTVTVTFSNYSNAAIDLPSGTLSVTVWNNAFHGLVLSGSLGRLRNAKVRGFTGVSVATGNEIDSTTGVQFAGFSDAYYWKAEVNVASAAGWPLVISPRNNENEFTFGTFPFDGYGDVVPKRAPCINQVVIGGLTNKFNRMSLETNSSEEAVLLVGNANLNETVGLSYIEYNTSYATPPFPRVRARAFTAANRLRFRHPYSGKAIADQGVGNEIAVLPAGNVNGMQILPIRLGRNLVTNGDFENGLTSWSDFSAGGLFAVTANTGVLSGKRVHADFTAGRPSLSQTIDTAGGIPISGLIGQNITCNAFIKSNIANVKPRLNGITGNGGTVGDSTDEQLSVTAMIPSGTASLPLVITTDASGLTGFVEVSNVTCYLGIQAGGIAERTQPVGSATFNPPSIAAAGQTTTTVSVPGAALGDFAFCSFSLDLQAVGLNGYVNATDTVTCLFKNGTAAAVDLASGTLKARVIKQ